MDQIKFLAGVALLSVLASPFVTKYADGTVSAVLFAGGLVALTLCCGFSHLIGRKLL